MYRVRTAITGYGSYPALSTMFFNESGGTAQQAADAVRAYWAGFASSIGNGVSLQVEAEVALIDSADGSLTGSAPVTTTVVNGSSAGEPLPFATQALQRWITGVVLDGRFVRGRTFIPALTELLSTAGAPTTAILTTMATQAQNLIADANSVLVVWHRPSDPTLADGAAVVVAGHSEWAKWAVLRSRRD